jgi:hypothetical protein
LLRADPNVNLSRRRDQAQRAMLVSITTKRQTGESSRLSRLGQESRKSCLQRRPSPGLTAATDAIVKITLTTIWGTDLQIPKGDFTTLSPAGFSASSPLSSARMSARPSRCSNQDTVADPQHHRTGQMRLLPKARASSLQRAAGGFSATGSTGPRPSSFAFPTRRLGSNPSPPGPMKKRS